MTRERRPSPRDWKAEAKDLAQALAEIATHAMQAIGNPDSPDALLERGKILAFLHHAIASTKDEGPMRVEFTTLSGADLSPELQEALPALTEVVIEALIAGIEQGLHSDIPVRVVKLTRESETKQ
jgi:hypothetical protein